MRVHLHLPEYAELGQYDAGREPFYLQVLGQRFAEEDEEVLLHGVFHAVPFVVLVQLFYLLALVPVSETVFQQGERLGVDAGMVHRGVVVYAGDGDGEETPVSTDVLQALPVVGARDEGAVAGQGEGFDVVGLALRHVVLRDDSLQCCQLAGLHAFELLHVDDDSRGEQAGIVLVARVYYAVVEVLFPLGRQQAPNPAALSLSLLAVEDDDELVHVLVAQRAVHQAHYPPFEALLPQFPVLGRQGVGKLGDVVRPVPGGKRVQIVGVGVELLGVVGVYHGSEEILVAGDAGHLQVYEYGVVVLSAHGAVTFSGICRQGIGHEFEAVQDEVPADAVVLFQKAHHLVDDGLFLFLLCSGFAGLVGIDVGIVQGRFHVGILLSELVFRQSDGCLLVQALAVAFVAQGEEEVVAVACPEPGGALHGGHGLGEYQLLPRLCVLRRGGNGGGEGVYRFGSRPLLAAFLLRRRDDACRQRGNLFQQCGIDIGMRVEGHEVSPRNVLSASVHLYSEKGLVVLFGGAVQLQVYLLERGVGHLALSETVIQTPGVFRLHEDEQLVAVPFGGEETAQGVRVFVDEGPGLLQLSLFQVVDVERDDGVVAGDARCEPSFPVVGREGPEGKLLLDVVGFLHLSLRHEAGDFDD